ncbi:MAG: hypothetical protein BVN35_19785 [Proteobacteria bacterium ST_bin11]|nr:MAG: hypothetical protein BVN35_19785 [Proteobacteria bacterium ST_bin11]
MKNQSNFLLTTALALSLLMNGITTAAAQDFKARDQGPSQEQMLVRSDGNIQGMAFFRPVLSGVLYRAGFSGGDKSHTGLSAVQRQDLCKAGFSNAFYVDFGTNTDFNSTDCADNQLDYHKANSTSTHEALKVIHDIIKNPSKGPALVHCMWGVHSSGSVAAMALVQFCGWSETQAKSYWEKARNNANCSGGCDKWIDGKFKQFKVDPTLAISSEEQQRICPK